MTARRKLREHIVAAAPAARERWLRAAFSTGRADRTAVEAAVAQAHVAVGRMPPRAWHWFDSPYAAALGAGLIEPGGEAVRPIQERYVQLLSLVRHRLSRRERVLIHQVHDIVGGPFFLEVVRQLQEPIANAIPARVYPDLTSPEGLIAAAVARRFGHAHIPAEIWEAIAARPPQSFEPVHWHIALPDVDVMRPMLGLEVVRLDPFMAAALGCYSWRPVAGAAVLVDRPQVIRRDANGWLHAADGPAVRFADGFAIWCWHGLEMPPHIMKRANEISPRQILATANIEQRRALIEIYAHIHGQERVLADLGARLIGSDSASGLARHLYDISGQRWVLVTNGSAEPDGTRRAYLLGADPRTRTPAAAIAASYGIAERHYAEAVRT